MLAGQTVGQETTDWVGPNDELHHCQIVDHARLPMGHGGMGGRNAHDTLRAAVMSWDQAVAALARASYGETAALGLLAIADRSGTYTDGSTVISSGEDGYQVETGW